MGECVIILVQLSLFLRRGQKDEESIGNAAYWLHSCADLAGNFHAGVRS